MICSTLLVDDEQSVLDGIRTSLHKVPIEFICANSAKQALRILEEPDDIDVVVTDDKMPGMKGTRFLATIAQQHPKVLRIMLTGQGSVQSALKAINDGWVYRYLLKPCKPIDLLETIFQGLILTKLTDDRWRLLMSPEEQDQLMQQLGKGQESDWLTIGVGPSRLRSVFNRLSSTFYRKNEPSTKTNDKGRSSIENSHDLNLQLKQTEESYLESPEDVVLQHLNELRREALEYGTKGQAQKARTTARFLLSLARRRFGDEHRETLETIKLVGKMEASLGNPVAAGDLIKRALKKEIDVNGPEHIQVANTLVLLGRLYYSSGNLEKGTATYIEAMDLFEKISRTGADQPIRFCNQSSSCSVSETVAQEDTMV